MKKLIICDYIYKRYLLKYKASHDFPYKIMTKNELYDSLCFSYSEEALKILLETKQYDYSALKLLTDILKPGDLSIKDKDTNNIKEKKKKLNIYLELLKKNKAIIYDDLINEELKNLRKEVRMTVRIEKYSLEIEERLRKAEEQNQNEKRVEHKEKESQEVR